MFWHAFDAHKKIHIYDEIYNRRYLHPVGDKTYDDFKKHDGSFDDIGFLNYFETFVKDDRRRIGFTLQTYYQMNDFILREIAGRSHIKVLHVIRKNLLRRFISEQLANRTDVWKQMKGDGEPMNMELTCDVNTQFMLSDFKEASRLQNWIYNVFGEERVYTAVYEDMIDDFSRVVNGACDFLNITKFGFIEPKTVKLENRLLVDMINNYEEVADAIIKNGYESFLD